MSAACSASPRRDARLSSISHRPSLNRNRKTTQNVTLHYQLTLATPRPITTTTFVLSPLLPPYVIPFSLHSRLSPPSAGGVRQTLSLGIPVRSFSVYITI